MMGDDAGNGDTRCTVATQAEWHRLRYMPYNRGRLAPRVFDLCSAKFSFFRQTEIKRRPEVRKAPGNWFLSKELIPEALEVHTTLQQQQAARRHFFFCFLA